MHAGSASQAVTEVGEADRVQAMVERVLADPLYWFPIRHHSPSAAHLLAEAIRQRRPKLLLIEAPSGMEALVPHLLDSQTRPPVALYCSFRDDLGELAAQRGLAASDPPLQSAAWFPLHSYSPEYVAMQVAAQVDAEVVFIDLPPHARAAEPVDQSGDADPDSISLEHSRFYLELARAAGYDSWDQAWDSLFEDHGGAPRWTLEDYRRKLASFCAAARVSAGEREDNLARERYMHARLEQALSERGCAPDQAMLVCGGWHLFMDRSDPDPPPTIPKGTTHHALVPYSETRIWQHSGYGAGNRAPQFYRRLYQAILAGQPDQALQEQAVEILQRARAKGERLAAADAIAVRHHAVMLAQLRRRPAPILDDLDDALISCCVKGDPAVEGALLREVMIQTHVGKRVGEVTANAGQLPLVRDFHRQLATLQLSSMIATEDEHALALDRRQPGDRQRSVFLHRLKQLEVPLATLSSSHNPLDQSLFREHWQLRWSPEVESSLIERSLDGDSVESAAGVGFERALRAAGLDARGTCRLLLSAVSMALPQLLQLARSACAQAVDEDPRLVSLADALASLRMLQRGDTDEQTQRFAETLIEHAWDRACFAVPEIAAAPAEQREAIIDALKSLAEVALTHDQLDRELLVGALQTAIQLTNDDTLRGAFQAILIDLGVLAVSSVAAELANYAQAHQTLQIRAGDYLHGLLRASTTAVMLGAGPLVSALDTVLGSVDAHGFMAMLPRLRGAIEALHPRQREAFASQVARHLGVATDQLEQQLPSSAKTLALIAEIDREVRQIMQQWEQP